MAGAVLVPAAADCAAQLGRDRASRCLLYRPYVLRPKALHGAHKQHRDRCAKRADTNWVVCQKTGHLLDRVRTHLLDESRELEDLIVRIACKIGDRDASTSVTTAIQQLRKGS